MINGEWSEKFFILNFSPFFIYQNPSQADKYNTFFEKFSIVFRIIVHL